MNTLSPHLRLLRYLTTTTAVGGGLAHGAVVYQSFELSLTDADSTVTNPDQTLAAIRFDGTSVTLTHSATGGALSLSADDAYLATPTDPKTNQGGRLAGSPYLQTATILGLGDVIASGFTAAGTSNLEFSGSATDQYLGVSAPGGYLGWVRFSYGNDGTTVTVHDAAFETVAGRSILAGTLVPEPSSLGLAGLAGGLAFLRRRRSAAA